MEKTQTSARLLMIRLPNISSNRLTGMRSTAAALAGARSTGTKLRINCVQLGAGRWASALLSAPLVYI